MILAFLLTTLLATAAEDEKTCLTPDEMRSLAEKFTFQQALINECLTHLKDEKENARICCAPRKTVKNPATTKST